MFVSEINSVNFKGKLPNVKPSIKKTKAPEAFVSLLGETSSQVRILSGTVEKLHGLLRKLDVQKCNAQAQNCMETLRAKHGFVEVLDTPAEGLVVNVGDGKNFILSSHGHSSFRMREQNAKTGEIENSIFINDKRIAKTDTRYNVPNEIAYLQHGDIDSATFEKSLQDKLDNADFALLRVRRELAKPEYQAEINKVGAAQIMPVVTPKVIIPAPASKVNVVTTNELIKTTDDLFNPPIEFMATTPVKRLGRPKGSKNKPKPQVQAETPQTLRKPHASSLRIFTDEELALTGDIKSVFKNIYFSLYSENLGANTRSIIKNGYGPKLGKGVAGSRMLNFVGIGKDGTDVGVNVVKHLDWELLQLRLNDKSGKVKDVIINQQGKATRTSVAVKDSARTITENKVYTREEIDELEIVPTLQRLKDELSGYHTYLEDRIAKSQEWKASHGKGGKVKKADPKVETAEVKPEPEIKPRRGRKPKVKPEPALNTEQLIQHIQAQINQIRTDLDKHLRALTSQFNELQENLMKLIGSK